MRYKMLPDRRIVSTGDSRRQIDDHWELNSKMRFYFGIPPLETLRKLGFEGGSKESFVYLDNGVSNKSLEVVNKELQKDDSSGDAQNWYLQFHLSRLQDWQQKGVHFIYAFGNDHSICTCGLFVRREYQSHKAEEIFGHRELPNFGRPVFSFITKEFLKDDNGVERFTLICQLCKARDFARESVKAFEWASEHPKACPCVEWTD